MTIKQFNDWRRQARGFTLIELLIVIALLGALAVGMLAAIDPLEQIKKGTDTATRNTVSEIYNAMIRFYAIKTEFPWGTDAVDTVAMDNATALNYISDIIDAGELKNDFVQLAGTTRLNDILLTSTDKDSLTVCFEPVSKSFQNDPNTKWSSVGSDRSEGGGTECKSLGGTEECFWCVK